MGGWRRRLGWGALLLLYLYLHLATSSRSAWLGLMAAVAGMLLIGFAGKSGRLLNLKRKVFSTRKFALTHAALLAMLLGVLALIPLLLRQFRLGGHGTLDARLDIWRFALDKISASPILGYGPGSALFWYTQRPDWIGVDEIFHTHNIWLEILFNNGLVGLLILICAILLVWQAFRSAMSAAVDPSPERASLIAYAGVGIAILVQGMLDYLFWQPLVAVTALYLVMLVYKLAPTGEWIAIRKRAGLVIGAGLLAICAGSSLYLGKGADALAKGLSAANGGDWQAGSTALCGASKENPRATYLRFQCSLSLAYLSEEQDRDENIRSALEQLRLGLAEDPWWYVHDINLASYEWQTGDSSAALVHMRHAAEAAPRRVQIWLNLGWMEEQAGETEAASKHYLQAACLNPWYRDTLFFGKNPLRRDVLKMDCPSEIDTLSQNPYTRLLRQAVLELDSGNLISGAEIIHTSFDIKPSRSDFITLTWG